MSARTWCCAAYERARKGADIGMQLATGAFRYVFGATGRVRACCARPV